MRQHPISLSVLLPCVLTIALGVSWPPPAGASQEPPAEAEAEPSGAPESEHGAVEDAPGDSAEEARERASSRGVLPQLELLFPEGDLDLRLNRLVKRVFFEGQVKYNFLEGDISAFLRYRYYGYQRTYQITGFDSVEFEEIENFSSDFERTRGLLALIQWPHDYHHRTSLLFELDRISSNKEELRFDNNRTNNFIRLGYQLGTPNDSRSNAIVGETRAEVEQLFSAHRRIGPGDAGLTGALTYGFDFLNGDFDYVKLELAALKRFEMPRRAFLVGRLNAGTFPRKRVIRDGEDLPEPARLSIPRNELFRIDGRNKLKGLTDRALGTEQLYTTWEYFFPWFVHQNHQRLKVTWQNWYWVIYTGVGTAGFNSNVYGDFGEYVPDLGFGFEASFRFRDDTFFLAGAVARSLRGAGGPEAYLSLKSRL